jgi:hypothetical protein
MLKVLLCAFIAAVVGGFISVIWWSFDDEVRLRFLCLPPCAIYWALWFVLPEERERPRRVGHR